MLNVKYSHYFVRKVSKLEDSLVEEIQDKIELLKDNNVKPSNLKAGGLFNEFDFNFY